MGAAITYRTGLEFRRSTKLNDIFEQARYAVGEEESLERKYRLEPGPEVRARHSAAGVDLVDALQRAARMGDQADRQGVLAKHEQYLEAIRRMFAAVDAHDTEASNAIDSAEVDPSFDAIESDVVTLSDQHRANAAQQLDALTTIQSQVVVASPVVFTFGAALVLFFWLTLRTVQRRAQESMVGVDAVSGDAELFQGGFLSGEVLLVGGATGVANQGCRHDKNVPLMAPSLIVSSYHPCETPFRLVLQGLKSVA